MGMSGGAIIKYWPLPLRHGGIERVCRRWRVYQTRGSIKRIRANLGAYTLVEQSWTVQVALGNILEQSTRIRAKRADLTQRAS